LTTAHSTGCICETCINRRVATLREHTQKRAGEAKARDVARRVAMGQSYKRAVKGDSIWIDGPGQHRPQGTTAVQPPWGCWGVFARRRRGH
jgi:hypothetical protein